MLVPEAVTLNECGGGWRQMLCVYSSNCLKTERASICLFYLSGWVNTDWLRRWLPSLPGGQQWHRPSLLFSTKLPAHRQVEANTTGSCPLLQSPLLTEASGKPGLMGCTGSLGSRKTGFGPMHEARRARSDSGIINGKSWLSVFSYENGKRSSYL